MYMKFKRGQTVIVNGIGKCDDKVYKNEIAKVIERDCYFKDFHVRFKDKSTDWLLSKYLSTYTKKTKKEKHKYEN